MKIIYIEIDGRMKKMMKTILDYNRNQTENSTHKGCIMEYLLICTKCEEQTGYSCPLFALQNAWEHIPITQHNLVTILEILDYVRI
jgi:hypothetical protein